MTMSLRCCISDPLVLHVITCNVLLYSCRALSCRLLLTLPEGATALVEAHIIEVLKRLLTALAAAAGERARTACT
jgi:hypothetical protein